MARPSETRGYYVSEKDPTTPLHCKAAFANGLRPITEGEARALSAAKRAGSVREAVAGAVAPADTQAVVDAINALEGRIVATVAQQVAAQRVEVPDLTGLTEALQDHERRIGALEQDREAEGSDGPVSTGGTEPTAPPPLPDADDYDAQFSAPPVIGDWREAIKRMEDDDPAGPAEDFGIGLEGPVEPEPSLYIPEEPSVTEQEPAPEPPPVPKTVVISETRHVTDDSWGKAQIAYEIAIQAKNGNVHCRGLLMEPAARRGMTVQELAEQILRERDELVQRVMGEF